MVMDVVFWYYIYNFDGLVKFVVVLHSRQTGFGKSQKNLFDKKFIRSFCTPNSHWVIIRKMCHAAPGKMVHESIHFLNPGILYLLISSPYFVNCSVYRYLVVTVLVVTPTTSNTASFSKAKMSRRYDSSTTTFSPEGRLHQVRFATVVYMESFIAAANLLIWYVFPHFLVGGICYRSHQ